ncbi:MAG: thioesterase [Nitrosomonas sp.]|nr:thioesterase [Nitrosomonas sp.]MDP1950503.1 thioesterase [Nitrosomonas sp.]
MEHPVLVLLHGYLGFSHYGPIRYFRGIASALHQIERPCLSPTVPPAGTIAERAESLAQQLFQSDIPAFSLLAHSMGGLDARYLIRYLDPDCRVKRLVTVGTPHAGTPVATWFLESPQLFPAWIRRIGTPGLCELTPATRLAAPIPDREDVEYYSYAGSRPLNELPFWLRPFGRMIPTDNDGLVAVESAQWGKYCGTIRADHFEFIGWSFDLPNSRIARPFDHINFWIQAVKGAENDK